MTNVIIALFQAYDALVIVACSIAMVRAIPEEIHAAKWKRILAWVVYLLLACFLPLLRSDMVTVIVMTLYYVAVGRLLYFKNKMGMLYQVIYWMVFFTMQYMAAYLMAYLANSWQMEMVSYVCVMILFRSTFLILGTMILRKLVQKRYKTMRR